MSFDAHVLEFVKGTEEQARPALAEVLAQAEAEGAPRDEFSRTFIRGQIVGALVMGDLVGLPEETLRDLFVQTVKAWQARGVDLGAPK